MLTETRVYQDAQEKPDSETAPMRKPGKKGPNGASHLLTGGAPQTWSPYPPSTAKIWPVI